MLPIKFLREHKDAALANAHYRGMPSAVVAIEDALRIDAELRALSGEVDSLRNRRNVVSKAINEAKKSGAPVDMLLAQAKQIPEQLAALEERKVGLTQALTAHLLQIPNVVHPDVPQGASEKDNVVRATYGAVHQFTFPIKSHVEVAEGLGLVDFESAARVSGKGFFYLLGDLALLNQALIQFSIASLVNKGYTLVEPPLMIRKEILEGVYSKVDIDQQVYSIAGEDLHLIATSEHPLIGMYAGKRLDHRALPIKLVGYSQCFRKETGSHGLDERGLFRTHQFNKVEQVVICSPEDSWRYFDELFENTVEIFTKLELPVQTLEMCTGDLGIMKARQFDLEVFSPRRGAYIEVGSCSNLTDNQAILLDIRAQHPVENFFPHTLNNTAIATSRAMVAVLENNQREDGSVMIPKVLRPYMGGKEFLAPLRRL